MLVVNSPEYPGEEHCWCRNTVPASQRQVELFRQFYSTFPTANTLYSQLSWSQYELLIRLDSYEKHDFYSVEAVKITRGEADGATDP